ncbi:hypothetical protein QBC44DRAFT_316959 [Cladorrhinum sp. PSN332]|nr:hypothetical protein QBC44DRAFT_316959 [Cladorrhinum sp. PSN332]
MICPNMQRQERRRILRPDEIHHRAPHYSLSVYPVIFPEGSISGFHPRLTMTSGTASVSKDSSKVAQAIREHIKNRVGEAEGGLAFLEVLHDAPDIQAEDLALTYGVNAVPSLVVFDPKWQMPVDEGARVTDLAKLRDDLLITEFLKETARRGKEERSNGKYK